VKKFAGSTLHKKPFVTILRAVPHKNRSEGYSGRFLSLGIAQKRATVQGITQKRVIAQGVAKKVATAQGVGQKRPTARRRGQRIVKLLRPLYRRASEGSESYSEP
jgi:hypothetical protein